ncbi:MAG TPA: HDOD domain-containing protein [Spirochaetes bacterium]|nr:HDOD domain-containing protein [Spirochaetota bacterium]
MKQIVDKVKDSIDRMPTLSPVIHKINEVANNVKSSAQELTDVIQLDPVLTAKVIRMVNSAYFGLSQEIKSLKQAVVMLGINTIKNVALSSAMLGKLALKGNTALDEQGFWKHSLGVAVASKMLARGRGIDDNQVEEYFIAGLIHDIGKVLINNFFPEQMNAIMERLGDDGNGDDILTVEKKVLGLTHEEIGIAIGKKWRFSNSLLYAVGRHHQPLMEGPSALYSMMVCVADTFAKSMAIGFSGNSRVEPVPEAVWQALEYDEARVLEILSGINEEIEKAVVFLT